MAWPKGKKRIKNDSPGVVAIITAAEASHVPIIIPKSVPEADPVFIAITSIGQFFFALDDKGKLWRSEGCKKDGSQIWRMTTMNEFIHE